MSRQTEAWRLDTNFHGHMRPSRTFRGDDFFHIIRRIYPDGQFLIGNNVGAVNGKVKRRWIFGKCIGIRDHEPELAALAAGR